MAKYASEYGNVATWQLTLHVAPATSPHVSPKSTSIVVPGSALRCTKASFGFLHATTSTSVAGMTSRAGCGGVDHRGAESSGAASVAAISWIGVMPLFGAVT